MRCLYYIPHLWEDHEGNPFEKTTWEDIYLTPDNPGCQKSIWLTVTGYQADDIAFPCGYIYKKTWFDEGEFELFEKQGYLIRSDHCDMIVFTPEFTKQELLGWAELFLKEEGYAVTELVEAPFEAFAGTNQHACNLAEAKRMAEEYKKDPKGHSISLEDVPDLKSDLDLLQ